MTFCGVPWRQTQNLKKKLRKDGFCNASMQNSEHRFSEVFVSFDVLIWATAMFDIYPFEIILFNFKTYHIFFILVTWRKGANLEKEIFGKYI